MSEPAVRSEDPRVARSKAAVLDATRDLLREAGFSGVTIEAVALRSGVAKTTIYRHWPERADLLLDAFALPDERPPVPCTDDLRSDLLFALRVMARELHHGDWIALMPAMIEASERDEEFLAVSRPFIESKREPLKHRLRVAVRAGDLPADVDLELALASFIAPMFYRRLITHQPLTDRVVERIVDQALDGLRTDTSHR
jgi:AcrR family transcriptional regulator